MVFNINERYLFAINLLLAALIIPYFAARTVSAMIKLHYAAEVVTQPHPRVAPSSLTGSTGSRPLAAYSIIKQRDVFNLALAPEVAAPVENENLNITLLGTSHLTGAVHEFIIVEDQQGAQQLYRLGETIPNVGRLVQVGKNRAVIEHNGHRVSIEIPKDSLGQSGDDEDALPTPMMRPHGLRTPFMRNPMIRRGRPMARAGGVHRLGPNKYLVERSTINRDMQNLSQLMTEVRALPVLQNGTSNGFRLSEIQPGSLFDEIGLHDGDVLTAVSGQQLNDPARALQMLSTIQTRSAVTVNLLRDGAPVQLNYTIH
jgi:type II secretion system protein C